MFKHLQIENLNDYFLDLGKRREKGVYVYRFNGFSPEVQAFILKYYEAARMTGVIIEGKLPNPDNNQLNYYGEIMGMDFQLNPGFIKASLRKWLPRMNLTQCDSVSGSIYETLVELKRAGKNENMLKNTYIKFMCWLYYKFERIVNRLGEEQIPKILYDGNISSYEYLLMQVLAGAGCDIVLLQLQGDVYYSKADPKGEGSFELEFPGLTAFPQDYSLAQIRRQQQEALQNERLYGKRASVKPCINAWMSGEIFQDLRQDPSARGEEDSEYFYNSFVRIEGVEDAMTYQNELFQLNQDLKKAGRRIVIVNDKIEAPTLDEIAKIRRGNYKNLRHLITDLSANIRYKDSPELERLMVTAFVDLFLEEEAHESVNLNRLTNRAVYLLCLLNRYIPALLEKWRIPQIGCFFYMGVCTSENEALFLRFLSRLPVDVVLFSPDLNQTCCLEDPKLYVVHNAGSMVMKTFPEAAEVMQAGTAAYFAERDLDRMMYTDTGLYRNKQYAKANVINLRTMYEEIGILWDQELKYRPNFNTEADTVSLPVIFSKICGVKEGDVQVYWSEIKKRITDETHVVKKIPNLTGIMENPFRRNVLEFFRNGKVKKKAIKEHRNYPFGFMRESMQDYLLDKLQVLIDQKVIKGTFENGTEYTIVSTVLNLDKELLRMIQKFDFTQKNPKIIYVITGEEPLSLEDTIQASFLNLVGFDVLFFVPTGYQVVEKYLNRILFEEHENGEYIYDLQVPDFNSISTGVRRSWRDIFFKR